MVTDTPEDKSPKSASSDSVGWVLGVWKKVGQFFVANPTLILSLLYALLTGVGILSSWSLYKEFEINIFDYAEIGDFLVAAFKSPGALFNLAYFLVTVLLSFLVVASLPLWVPWMTRVLYFGSSQHSESAERFRRFMYFSLGLFPPIWVVALGVIYGQWVIQARTEAVAQDIKDGVQPRLTVQYRSFSNSAGHVTIPKLQLIGSTQRFAFFYDKNNKRTIVVPQAQIVAIKVPE
jgi:hypothetical protein